MGMELDLKEIDKIVAEWELKKMAIEANAQKLYIVNVGRMNHGKSSLFNALLGREYFKTGDLRVTVKCSEIEIEKNVFLVDTPGLDNDEEDDQEAFEAYANANCIIYVHNVKVGELHAKEIKHLQYIKKMMSSSKYLKEHFCLVFTGKDEYDEDEFNKIKNKTLALLEEHCQLKGVPVFNVSNTTYIEGISEGGDDGRLMIEYSGIEELRQYMKEHYSIWRKSSWEKVETQLKNESQKYSEKLADIRKKYLKHKADLAKKEKKTLRMLSELDSALLQVEEYHMEIELKFSKVSRLKKELKNMEDAHKKAKANY